MDSSSLSSTLSATLYRVSISDGLNEVDLIAGANRANWGCVGFNWFGFNWPRPSGSMGGCVGDRKDDAGGATSGSMGGRDRKDVGFDEGSSG
ncbi:hypothetical protein CRG98_039341 [Punica granatum]|uniref:Uncharacterized protein n=1 Tax=Punica granatum TaxID=22663 RepID=A0A2I0I8D9_PUNGR|nr:hypothetical protein CRG98_039341 [Punica granatum]